MIIRKNPKINYILDSKISEITPIMSITNIKNIKDALNIVGNDKLRKIIIRSDKEHIECGFRFCINDGITTSKMCLGEECGVRIAKCDANKRAIGSFHTHPRGDDRVSAHDIKDSIASEEDFACIGTLKKKEKKFKPIIRCYLTKNYGINNFVKQDVIDTVIEREKRSFIHSIKPEEIAEYSKKIDKYINADKLLSKATYKISGKMYRAPNKNADLSIEL